MNHTYTERKYGKTVKAVKADLKVLIKKYDDQEALEKMMDGK